MIKFLFLSLMLSAQVEVTEDGEIIITDDEMPTEGFEEPVLNEPLPMNNVETNPLRELDEEILKARMRRIYWRTSNGKTTYWEVTRPGAVETWTWDGRKGRMSCPKPEEIECNDYIPVSFKWWLTNNTWMEPWESFRREGFLLEQEKVGISTQPASRPALTNFLQQQEGVDNFDFTQPVPSAPEFEADSDDELIRLGGKRLALEKWTWQSQAGQRINVFLSLRNQWIERIDQPGSTEYIEWKKRNRWSKPSLNRVIYESSGIRLSFLRSKKP